MSVASAYASPKLAARLKQIRLKHVFFLKKNMFFLKKNKKNANRGPAAEGSRRKILGTFSSPHLAEARNSNATNHGLPKIIMICTSLLVICPIIYTHIPAPALCYAWPSKRRVFDPGLGHIRLSLGLLDAFRRKI